MKKILNISFIGLLSIAFMSNLIAASKVMELVEQLEPLIRQDCELENKSKNAKSPEEATRYISERFENANKISAIKFALSKI